MQWTSPRDLSRRKDALPRPLPTKSRQTLATETFTMKLYFSILFCLQLIVCAGCYQRTIAPELSYDQTQVEALDQEIKNLEWD